jgi:hypothetical protein
MNLSEITTKKLRLSLVPLLLSALAAAPPSLAAQDLDKPVPPLTFQERMQKSLARQMDAVAAMQKSVEARQTALRQSGETSAGNFFTLPAPVPMESPFRERPIEAVEAPDDADESNDASESSEQPQSLPASMPPEPDRTVSRNSGTRIEVPWKSPVAVPLSVALPADIAGIQGIDGIGASGDLSLEGMLLRQLTSTGQEKSAKPPLLPGLIPATAMPATNGNSPGSSPAGPGTMDYIRQILDFGVGGSSLFQGLTGVR